MTACDNCGNEIQPGTTHEPDSMGLCNVFRNDSQGKFRSGFSKRKTWQYGDPMLMPEGKGKGEQK